MSKILAYARVAVIYLNRRPDTGYADPMNLRSGNANIWIYGVFEI